MVKEPTALEDLSTKREWVGVAIPHPLEDFDFIVEPFGDGSGESGLNIGLNIPPVLPDQLCKFTKGFKLRLSH
jgi:hypothetical protein